jgi:feruloyl esterase
VALEQVHDGVRDAAGHQIYPGFGWDAGWFDQGWRIWMTGSADGRVPALNVVLGGRCAWCCSLRRRGCAAGADAMLAAQMAFVPAQGAAAIMATAPGWPRSAWQDVGAHEPDLDRFRARGGRLIVPHGASDPVFSLNDTLAWWRALDRHSGGQAAGLPGCFRCRAWRIVPAAPPPTAMTRCARWPVGREGPRARCAGGQGRAGPPWPGGAAAVPLSLGGPHQGRRDGLRPPTQNASQGGALISALCRHRYPRPDGLDRCRR